MRRILTGFALAAAITMVPALALADNQQVAEQIAQSLRTSSQLDSYKIGVKYQDGTVWLRGNVSDEKQMNAALKLAFQTPSVTRVVNELTIATTADGQSEPAAVKNPLREAEQPQKLSLAKRLESVMSGGSEQEPAARADRLPSSFGPASAKTVSAEEPQEEVPQQMAAPQRARPMANQYMAMQPGMRGPMAPNGGPMPMYTASAAAGPAPARYDQPCLPNYAWPSYAAYPNYAAVTYPKQYSPTAWPYIGPFYPYPQVPLGWRKVTLEWDSGWWFLDFKDQPASCWQR